MRGLLVIALVGCYRPNDASCVVTCETTADCHGGLTCTDNLCGPPGGCTSIRDDAQRTGDATLADATVMDALASDAHADAGPDAGCTTTMVTANATSDAMLDGARLTMNYGSTTTLAVSSMSSVIWRFELSGIPASSITGVELQVQFATEGSTACGGCGMTCLTFERSGMITLWPIRNDWTEPDVTFTNITPSAGWQVQGALGALDRGPMLASAFHALSTDLDIVLTPGALAIARTWVRADPSGKLGISLLADTTIAGFVSASREYFTSDCGQTATSGHVPRLVVTACN